MYISQSQAGARREQQTSWYLYSHTRKIVQGLQVEKNRCPTRQEKLQGWALTSGFSGLLAVHQPRQSDDDKERKNGRLRKPWEGQVR